MRALRQPPPQLREPLLQELQEMRGIAHQSERNKKVHLRNKTPVPGQIAQTLQTDSGGVLK